MRKKLICILLVLIVLLLLVWGIMQSKSKLSKSADDSIYTSEDLEGTDIFIEPDVSEEKEKEFQNTEDRDEASSNVDKTNNSDKYTTEKGSENIGDISNSDKYITEKGLENGKDTGIIKDNTYNGDLLEPSAIDSSIEF